MSLDTKQPSLEERVLGPIKQGQVKMTPRWHFVLQTVCLSIGGTVILLTLFYLTSFIIFMLDRTGISSVPNFGARGWYAFLISFPWILVLLAGIFIVLLEFLVRRTAFAYRRPVLYSTIGIIILVIGGGYIVAATPLHRDLADYADKGQFPVGNILYQRFGEPPSHNIHHGQIIRIFPNGFQMKARRTEALNVRITPRTRLPYGADFDLGDIVVVFGNRSADAIEAYGIREVQE